MPFPPRGYGLCTLPVGIRHLLRHSDTRLPSDSDTVPSRCITGITNCPRSNDGEGEDYSGVLTLADAVLAHMELEDDYSYFDGDWIDLVGTCKSYILITQNPSQHCNARRARKE